MWIYEPNSLWSWSKLLLTSQGTLKHLKLNFSTLGCIEALSMGRFPQSCVWQLWKMHGVYPLEADVHFILISHCSHRPSLRLRSARTDAEVVEHDRSCECEMLTAVALNNWSDVFYSCYVFFLSLKISGCLWIIHEHKIMHHSCPAFQICSRKMMKQNE